MKLKGEKSKKLLIIALYLKERKNDYGTLKK